MDLPTLDNLVQESLQWRARELSDEVHIQPSLPFQQTPDKGYTAKTITTLTWKKQPLGTLTIIAFSPGDGTGSQEHYQLPNTPSAWTPRNKQGIAELFIAVGTYHQGAWYDGITSLHAVTLNKKKDDIKRYKLLTNLSLQQSITKQEQRHFDFTINKTRNYGNPHAIIWPEKLTTESIQVAAFLHFQEHHETLDTIKERLQTVYWHET
ncbi:MAG: hypothetical protein Q7R96_02955 [Nanoarchaeota archaeon]|nr:hypothetical protein [Nanoarchaeota archaeon]